MNLYKIREENILKTWILMLVFIGMLGTAGYYLGQYYRNPLFLYGFLGFSLVMQVVAYWKSSDIVLSLHGAKEANKKEQYDLYTITENLAITAGLPMPALYVYEDPSPNAFATGRNEKHAVVCVSTGILSILERRELEGVIAHELSHIKNRDILLMTIVSVLVGFLGIISDFVRNSFLWGGMGGASDDEDRSSGIFTLVIGIVISLLAPLVGFLIQCAVSRKREFMADASGALLTRYPEGLAAALEKIERAHIPMENPSSATAHLFIANPFSGQSIKNIFSTHPPTEDRIRNLRGMKI